MLRTRLLILVALMLGIAGFSSGPASAFPVQTPAFQDPGSELILPVRHDHGGYGYPRYWRHYNYGYSRYWRHDDYGYPRYWRYRNYRNYGYYPRCGYWNDWCSSYYGGGYWYGGYYDPWWYGPSFGTTFVFSSHHHHGKNRHEKWCANRYRSYNARTDTWVSYSGKVRRCVSPYRQ